MKWAKVAIPILLLALACCSRRQTTDYSKTERFPDAEGIVTSVDFERIRLDEDPPHVIDRSVQSFSTYNGKVAPLLSWKSKYVHLGLGDRGRVIWVSGIGVVVDDPETPVVYYTEGVVERVDSKGRVIFQDGTVLTLDGSVEKPAPKSKVTAKIDPQKERVIELLRQ